jgi:hypothetical protein
VKPVVPSAFPMEVGRDTADTKKRKMPQKETSPKRNNKKSVSHQTDTVLCSFLNSELEELGLNFFKKNKSISFPEEDRKVRNRLAHLRIVRAEDPLAFSSICQEYNVAVPKKSPPSNTESEDEQEEEQEEEQPARRRSRKETLPTTPVMNARMNSNYENKESYTMHDLSRPEASEDGMLWFRDDKVVMGKEAVSILTGYLPLADPRDFTKIRLYLDFDGGSNSATALFLEKPKIPGFFVDHVEKIHKQEIECSPAPEHPDVFKSTKTSHQIMANQLKSNENRLMSISRFKLPGDLAVKVDHFGNSSSEIKKNYRQVKVEVTAQFKATCSYIFFKILIDGEAARLEPDAVAANDVFMDAMKRMSIA